MLNIEGIFTKSHPRLNGKSSNSRAKQRERLPRTAVCEFLRCGNHNFLATGGANVKQALGKQDS